MYKKNRQLLIIPILIMLVLFCGCWDANDINKQDIITTVVVGEEDGYKTFCIEIVNLTVQGNTGTGSGGSGKKKYSILSSKGKTYSDAREDFEIKLDHDTYLGAAQILVFTYAMASNGIEEYMYRLRDLPDYRKTLSVVTTDERPEELMEIQPENEESAGFAIASTLDTLARAGLAYQIRTSEILDSLSSQYDCFVIPCFNIEDEHIALTDYTVIHHQKAVGSIQHKESKGLVYMLTDHAKAVYTVPLHDNTVTITAKLKKRSIKPKLENGEVSFVVSLVMDAEVMYPSKKLLLDDENIAILKKNLEETIMNDINYTIQQAQKQYACDYLDFHVPFRIQYPEQCKIMKDDWCTIFAQSQVVTEIDLKLDPGGAHDYNSPIEE